jgi:hypothetical protein
MNSHLAHLRGFSCWSALLIVLTAAWLPATRAGAFPVRFDGPSGYGLSEDTADAAIDAGFARLTPLRIDTVASRGLLIPDPVVLDYDLSDSPSPSDPHTAISRWTVQNGGNRAFQDAWLVFLSPIGYSAPLVGIDLQAGEWRIVEVSVGSGEGSTEYFYPAVRLGNIAAGGSAQFMMHHGVGTTLTQVGNTLILPKYGVGVIGSVPGPAALPLLGVLLGAIGLRRRSAA